MLVLLLSVLSFSIFAGVELKTIVGPGHVQFYLQRAMEFTNKTGIKVDISVCPYGSRDIVTKLITSFIAGGHQYDIFVIDCVDVAQFADAGWVMPINKWVTPEMKEDIIPFARDGMMYKGYWYGLPWASEWKSFVYNDKMLKEAGYTEFPRTWDGVVKYSQKLQKMGIVRFATAFSWAQKECLTCDFVALAASFGGKFFDENLNPLFNKGGTVKALQWMVDSIYKYKIVDPASIMWTPLCKQEISHINSAGDIHWSD